MLHEALGQLHLTCILVSQKPYVLTSTEWCRQSQALGGVSHEGATVLPLKL